MTRGPRAVPAEISSSVLNDRLRELRETGIVAGGRTTGYRLSEDGHELLQSARPDRRLGSGLG